MQYECPTCRRTYDESGYCPFDRGVALVGKPGGPAPRTPADRVPAPPGVANAAALTIVSGQMPAQQSVTQLDPPKGTLPLTRSTAAAVAKQFPELKPEPPVVKKFVAVSAALDPSKALAEFHNAKDEYEALIGQTLDGRYYIDRKIGEGGMGVVFSARHAVIERPLAIKVLKREVMRDSATIKRFEQEAKAASRIGHPNIVDVTDFGTTPTGMTYQVMEYVDGETLGHAIRKSAPFPLVRIVRIGTQLARALGAAHDKGIVHRDLKPENVFLLDRDGRPDFVKIVDFGIAKIIPIEGGRLVEGPKLTRAGSVFGTPEYMAPEQAAGRADIDGRVDQYALGVLLYEMTTGRVPHRGESMVRTLAMVMMEPVMPPSKARPDLAIPRELEAVIMKTLAKKPADRFAKMSDLLTALDGLLTPVGLSLTGSAVYALVPLPPGADGGPSMPLVTPASPSMPTTISAASPSGAIAIPPHTGQRLTPRPRPLTKGRLHEPEFVGTEKPLTFEHVFTEDAATSRSRRWPLLLVLALLLGAAGGAIAIAIRHQRNAVGTAPLAIATTDGGAITGADAQAAGSAVTQADADAGSALAVLEDGGLAADAGGGPTTDSSQVAAAGQDAGVGGFTRKHPRDAGVPITHPPARTVRIQVITKPEGATLYDGRSMLGPDRSSIDRPLGTKLTITCKAPGYLPGTVSVVYDGQTEVVLCLLHRDRNAVCVPDLKNPFDDCQPASDPSVK